MHKRYKNKDLYFFEQSYTSQKYIISYIEQVKPINVQTAILEVGTGQGGNMEAFLKRGCRIVGIDISEPAIKFAKNKFKGYIDKGKAEFLYEDIYNFKTNEEFDIIFMKDTIEHIPNQDKLMSHLKQYLTGDGVIFIQFPPWHMPFGGHQQLMKSKLSKIPFIHLLPSSMYKWLMIRSKETEKTINNLMYIKSTGITIDRLKKIIKVNNYNVIKVDYYFINPNYEVKFKLKPRKQFKVISSIPHLRNYFITSVYFIISLKK